MTIDDENSVYVGGLPYTATEDLVRREFSPYGTVVDIKIVNDRSVRGKCYGFVTFTNPRSAADAIDDMDGRVIGGRVVRVNEVTTRVGRLNHRRDRSQYGDRSRGRDRERVYYHDRDMHWDRYHSRSRERHRSRDHYVDKAMEREHSCDLDRAENLVSDRDRDRERNLEDNGKERSSSEHDDHWERERKLDKEQDKEIEEINDFRRDLNEEKEQESTRPSSRDHHSRDRFSNSSEEYNFQLKERLEGSIQIREELQREILEMEKKLEIKETLVADLQKKSKRLEDALIAAKKQTSERKKHLTKLNRCFLQVNECTEKLHNCERELQSLVDSAMMELGTKDEVLANI